MMITFILIAITALVSWYAWQQQDTFYALCFYPYRIVQDKEWWRIITGGFIHADMQHLIFNMFSFYFFAPYVYSFFSLIFGVLGGPMFVVFYILAIVVSGIPDLILQRDNRQYTAVGASGGVSAVVFASILFSPTSTLLVFFIPMPAILYGVLFLVYSAYSARRGGDHIGHLAHFTGAIFGFVFPLLLQPSLLLYFIHQLVG